MFLLSKLASKHNYIRPLFNNINDVNILMWLLAVTMTTIGNYEIKVIAIVSGVLLLIQ